MTDISNVRSPDTATSAQLHATSDKSHAAGVVVRKPLNTQSPCSVRTIGPKMEQFTVTYISHRRPCDRLCYPPPAQAESAGTPPPSSACDPEMSTDGGRRLA